MKCLTLSDLKGMVGSSEPCLSSYISLVGSKEIDREKLENNLASAVVQARAMFPQVAGVFTDVDVPGLLSRLCVLPAGQKTEVQPWKSVVYFKSPSLEGYYPSAELEEDLVVLANSFHLKPLFSLIQVRPRYAMIRVDDNKVVLQTGTTLGISPPRVFERRAESLISTGPEYLISPIKKRLASIERSRLEKKNLVRFFRDTDAKIRKLVNLDDIPAIVIGPSRSIKSLIVANRFRTSFVRTIDTDRFKIVDDMDYLHQLALESLAMHDKSRALKGVFEFRHLRRFGCAVDALGQVAKAADEGVVKSLLIRKGINLWGKVSPKAGSIHLEHAGVPHASDDILDDIGEMVLSRGGEVHLLNAKEMPTHSPVAAVLAASLSA